MTAIVAWYDRESNKNYLATDGRAVCGTRVTTDHNPKIVKLGDYYLALAGLPRAMQLINLAIERGVDEFPSSPLELCEWVKAILDGDGWVVDESDEARCYKCFSGILVGPAGIFDIDTAFCMTRAEDRITYRGSGGCDMASALYALRASNCRLPVEEQVRIALEAEPLRAARLG